MRTEIPSTGDDRKVSHMTAAADSPSAQDRDTLEAEISMKLQTRPSEPLMQENCLQERARLRPSVSLEYEERYPFVKPSVSLEYEERYPFVKPNVSLESEARYPLTKKSVSLESEERYPLTFATPIGDKPLSKQSIQPVITFSEKIIEAKRSVSLDYEERYPLVKRSVSLESEARYPLTKPSVFLEPEERYLLDSMITQPNTLETEDDVKFLPLGYRNYRLDVMVGPTPNRLGYLTVVLDAGACLNLIRENFLPPNWQKGRVEQPRSGMRILDANGNRVSPSAVVPLYLEVGRTVVRQRFLFVPNLSVPGIVGCDYIDGEVDNISPKHRHMVMNDGERVYLGRRRPKHLSE